MLGSRHQAVVKEIDTARCIGRWHTIGALAARYAKNGPPGQVFSHIISSEARLEEQLLAVAWDPQAHWESEGEYRSTGESTRLQIRYPMHISDDSVISSIASEMTHMAKQAMTSEEEYQFKVVLAKVYFYGGKFDQCRGALDSLATTLSSDHVLSSAYGKQLYMAQMVMLGIYAEMQGKLIAAQELYEKAILEFKNSLSSQSVIVVPRNSSPSGQEELVNWPEEALYRRAMVLLALGDRTGGLRELASYIRQMDGVTPAAFRSFRRVRANRLYMQIVRESIEAGKLSALEVKSSVMSSHRRQMALLKATYGFPRANEAHGEVLHEVDWAAKDWELVLAHSRADSLRLVEVLYESMHLTYNSPRVLRHLVQALIMFGDYHEAGLAFGTYIALVERQLEAFRKAIGAAIDEGATDYSSVFGPNFESVNDILQATITGARLNVVNLSNAHECISLVHFAYDLISDVELRDPGNAIIPEIPVAIKAQLALWKGAAHGVLAQKSREPDNRADHHTAALQLLQQAVEQSPRSFDAHYQLALELAIGARDILAATASAKQAVALDSRRIEAWHLLALLSTSRKDYAKAQQICDVGLRQSEWWSVYCAIKQGGSSTGDGSHLGLDLRPGDNDSDHTSSIGGNLSGDAEAPAESGIAFFELAMTQMAIEGRLRGFDASLKVQSHLFALFGRIHGSAMASGDEAGDVSSAMEVSHIGAETATTLSHLRAGGGNAAGARQLAPSQASGRRSLARSLARSVFSKHGRQHSYNLPSDEADESPASHTRYYSHGGSRPPLPVLATSTDVADAVAAAAPSSQAPHPACDDGSKDGVDGARKIEKSMSGNSTPKYAEQPKRQRSMPHLRQASGDSMIPSPDIPTEAYFDTLGQLSEQGDGTGLSPSGGGGGSGRTNTVANLHSASGVYYTPVPTRLAHQRKLAKRALCAMWLATAASFVALQRMDEASNAISDALAAWPESPEALTMRGQLYMAQQQHLPALNELHAAVSLESNNIRASVSLARVEHLLGRRDVALGLLKNITRAHGWSDPEAWYWLGRLERELALEQASLSNASLQEDVGAMPMMKRALEYTTYALDLETSQPVRSFAALRQ
ncbi:hypothetical protein GGH93_000338 [Coemansia aciculifera]|nr:hypothetical protein GGH93_000338 [Coemansia aciculifera]